MNVLLIAAFENDVIPICRNIHLYETGENITSLLMEACEGGSEDVIRYIFTNHRDMIGNADTILHRIIVTKRAKSYTTLRLLMQLGLKPTEVSLFDATISKNLSAIYLLLGYGVKDENSNCLEQAILQGDNDLFRALWPEGNAANPKLLTTSIIYRRFEMAFYLQEKAKLLLDKNNDVPQTFLQAYLKYKQIMDRTRARAVTKIATWWIPFCYDLSRESGKRMMERSWNRVESMYTNLNRI